MRRIRNKQGFTIQELLITVAIMACLAAVSFVGVFTYMKHLKITELDNAARQIYMAAQNRITLMKAGSMLDSYIVSSDPSNKLEHVNVNPDSEETTQITAYYIRKDDENIQFLLPEGTIDPELWEGDFYIIYEPESASVVDVFYGEENLLPEGEGFPAFYEKWRAADKAERMKNDPMIGYYGGESAESGTSVSLRTPVISIFNEEELRVEVTYWEPALLSSTLTVDARVTLNYQGHEMVLVDTADPDVTTVPHITPDTLYKAYTYTWVLDSLEGQKFKEFIDEHLKGNKAFADPIIFGDDFTVTAEVYGTSSAGIQVNGAVKTATDNSLFAKGSGQETAYIEYTRHLQNLDTETSGVSDKKIKAEQRKDISCPDGYHFTPVKNEKLQEYNGADYSIHELAIKASGDATGLFGEFMGTGSNRKVLKNILLVNTTNQQSGNLAGALVGKGDYVDITGCGAFWEKSASASTNLRSQLGDSENGLRYVIAGGTAGGLAGSLSNSTITDSFASTLVNGTTVGGLVGTGSNLQIHSSYTSSYLKGQSAAGLVGALSGRGNTIQSTYTAGYTELSGGTSSEAAGFTLGDGSVAASQSYSAMVYSGEGMKYALCEGGGNYNNTKYLEADDVTSVSGCSVTYEELTDSSKWDALFGANHSFEAKTAGQSHAYNLQTTLLLEKYIYPGLKGMDHWGDFGARFQDGSLVYYEEYSTGGNPTYGFAGGSIDLLQDENVIQSDGYAVAFEGEDESSSLGYSMEITYMNNNGQETTETFHYGGEQGNIPIYQVSYDDSIYYLLPLPDKVVNTEYADADFYQKIAVRAENGTKTEEIRCYYNPHFANAIVEEGEDVEVLSRNLTAEIRTPRHLYMLSRHNTYYASYKQYNFVQQLDLDYSQYTGYGLFTENSWQQDPIGMNAKSPFRNNYYGSCHVISNVNIRTDDRQYIGLFGYSTGKIQDTVYFMDTKQTVRNTNYTKTMYVGGMLGYNGGTVDNCAVSGIQIDVGVYSFSTVYAGGFAGNNSGTISNSSADVEKIYAITNYSSVYAGGFAGINSRGGTIQRCYSVGRISVSRSQTGNVYACGFAGENKQKIADSYAAMNLVTSGDAQAYGFCKDGSTNCVYLNNGNFKYGDVFTAQYSDGKNGAQPKQWDEFTALSSGVADQLGMSAGADAYELEENYPYPGVVTAADGTAIHYGKWPEKMKLGVMGVYYWEKMETGSTESYHISVIKVDLDQATVTKDTTLSVQHADGGVVTEYGYGYFHTAKSRVSFQSDNKIAYRGSSAENEADTKAWKENQAANKAFQQLISSEYTFHSYNTRGTAVENEGLYLTEYAAVTANFPFATPSGTWSLTLTGENNVNYTASFNINPFFADSMKYEKGPVTISVGTADNVPQAAPGSESNPYQIRSIDQLQFINWNTSTENTKSYLENDAGAATRNQSFMFLSYIQNNFTTQRKYFWLQTHDLDGSQVDDYMPVAAFCDRSGEFEGAAVGWYEGSYDGNDYMIQNLSIKTKDINTTGLFGFTLNATLKNIVMYSSAEKTVEATNTRDNWYAIGGLVGLAAQTDENRVIQNCVVSGYKIYDNNHYCAFGGGGVGGLIGVCNLKLERCSAVNDIYIQFAHHDPARNVRVGGLVGSCQKDINLCYAGGNIILSDYVSGISNDKTTTKVHIGGVVGGYFMKALKLAGGTAISSAAAGEYVELGAINTISNSYSYVVLPDISGVNQKSSKDDTSNEKGANGSHLFAIGGLGEIRRKENGNEWHGVARSFMNYENCYYMDSSLANVELAKPQDTSEQQFDYEGSFVWDAQFWIGYDPDDPNGRPPASVCTAEQLSDPDSDVSRILTNAGFKRITTVSSSGAPLDGMFTYVTSGYLLGQNYPFPTILTQTSSLVEGGKANVHYGDWSIAGIKREKGTQPIVLDLFTGKGYTEQLGLAYIESGGTWSVTAEDENIVKASIDNSGNLSVEPWGTGNTVLTVKYILNGKTATLKINVNVTSEVSLTSVSSPVKMFTNETVMAELQIQGVNGSVLTGIQLDNIAVEADKDYLENVSISSQEEKYSLAASSREQTGTTQLTVAYEYSYNERTYQTTSVIAVEIIAPDIQVRPFEISVDEWQEGKYSAEVSQEELNNLLSIKSEDGAEQISGMTVTEVENLEGYQNYIWAELLENAEGKTVLGITVYEDTPAETAIGVTVEFIYGGSTHKMKLTLPIQIAALPDDGDGETGVPEAGETETGETGAAEEETQEMQEPSSGNNTGV